MKPLYVQLEYMAVIGEQTHDKLMTESVLAAVVVLTIKLFKIVLILNLYCVQCRTEETNVSRQEAKEILMLSHKLIQTLKVMILEIYLMMLLKSDQNSYVANLYTSVLPENREKYC